MKKYLLFFVILALISSQAWAQTTVSGQVTDANDGSGLPGVNIVEKGTTNGTVTDFDGNYTLSVSEGATIVYSFVGYLTKEVPVAGQTTIDVSLETDVRQLSEVVVVGYGVQDKKEVTSAVTSVSAEDFNGGNVSDPTQLVQGKVPGLSIVRAGGNPNEEFNIRLRGLSSFGANSQPLVVVDGVVGVPLESVDPNDIESIDVLKDGSAAAIYGTRGSAGVLIVTTKKGKAGEAKLDYHGFFSFEEIANLPDILDADEYLAAGGTDLGARTDWQDEISQTGISHTHSVSLSGGSESTTYRASFNYRSRESVAIGNEFERFNTRLAIQHNMMDNRLRLSSNILLSNRQSELVPLSAFRYATTTNPTAPIFDENNAVEGGYFRTDVNDNFNPVGIINLIEGERKEKISQINLAAEFDIFDELTAKVNYSLLTNNLLEGLAASKRDALVGRNVGGTASRLTNDQQDQLFEATLNYVSDLTDDLNMSVLAGYGYQEVITEGFNAQAAGFLTDVTSFNDLSGAANRQGGSTALNSFRNSTKLLSLFSRVNLNYDGTYFFSSTFRREGSSTFGANNRWGNFFAFSGGVELANLFDIPNVSSLKFRASYGETGNLPVGPGLSQVQYVSTPEIVPISTGDRVVIAPVLNANPDLKWEIKREFNVGIDFGFLDGKLTGSVEYYTRNIDDLLFLSPVPVPGVGPSGEQNLVGFTWLNIGELSNSGLEFNIDYLAIDKPDFTWNPSLAFTFYSISTLESLSGGGVENEEFLIARLGAPGQNDNGVVRVKEGDEIGNFFGPVFQGINENGEYILSAESQVIGNGLPEFELGFSNTFKYKNFDFNFFLRGVFGHELINTYRGFHEAPSTIGTFNIVTTDLTDLNLTEPNRFSSFYVEEADFLRLDNATLGYTFELPSNSILRNLRTYLAVQNLFTITDYTGVDPEVRYADVGRFQAGDILGRGENEIPDAAGNPRVPDPLAPGIERRNTFFTTTTFTFGVNLGL